MSITADFHMHSSHSGDGNTPMEEMIRQALNTGLTHLCFTEHQDFDYPASPDLPPDYFLLDTDAYRQELISVQEQYKDQIQVGFGVELGLQPHLTTKLQQYVKSWPFDFIIASSHVCNGQDPYYPAFYKGRPSRMPTGNTLRPYWKRFGHSRILTYMVIWTILYATARTKTKTIHMNHTLIFWMKSSVC